MLYFLLGMYVFLKFKLTVKLKNFESIVKKNISKFVIKQDLSNRYIYAEYSSFWIANFTKYTFVSECQEQIVKISNQNIVIAESNTDVCATRSTITSLKQETPLKTVSDSYDD